MIAYFLVRPWMFWLLVGSFIVAILGVGIFVVAPRVPAVRNWRADQLARQSLEAIEQGQWEKARSAARSAYQLSTRRLLPIRAAAELNAAAASPQALDFYRLLTAHPDATINDQLAHAEAAIHAASYREAGEILENLSVKNGAKYQRLRGRLALATGQRTQAIQHFQNASIQEPSFTSRLEYGLVRLASDDSAERDAGARDLQTLAEEAPEYAEVAYFALLGNPLSGDAIRESAISRLEALPGRDYARKIRIAAERISLNPEKMEAILSEVSADAESVEERRLLARLLLSLGRSEDVLELLPLAVARSGREDLLLRMDAMAALGDWREILNVLETSNLPLEPSLIRLFSGRAREELGETTAAAADYEAASRLPTSNPTLLLYTAGYLHRIGRTDDAEFVLRRMENDPLVSRLAAESLVNIHRSQRNTEKLVHQITKMAERWPKDLAVRNDFFYLSLLREENLAESLNGARELVLEDPEAFAPRITLALALAQNGDSIAALEVFQGSGVQLNQLLPFQRAIFAGLLRRNGMGSAADAVIATIQKPEGLLREERAFAGLTP